MSERKEYVKLWLSYETYFQAYSPEEVGNIVLAMLAYKDCGKEPDFQGPERFIWPAIRRDINEAREAQEAAAAQHRVCGKKGGRSKKEDAPSEDTENQIGSPKTNLPTRTKDKSHGHCQGQGQDQGLRPCPAWAREKMDAADRLVKQLLNEAREEALAKEAEMEFYLPPTMPIPPLTPDGSPGDQSPGSFPPDR